MSHLPSARLVIWTTTPAPFDKRPDSAMSRTCFARGRRDVRKEPVACQNRTSTFRCPTSLLNEHRPRTDGWRCSRNRYTSRRRARLATLDERSVIGRVHAAPLRRVRVVRAGVEVEHHFTLLAVETAQGEPHEVATAGGRLGEQPGRRRPRCPRFPLLSCR